MSDDTRVRQAALVYIDCPGEGCGWSGPVMADVSRTHAREKRMQCPRCGRYWIVRAELDVEVTVEGPPSGAVRETAEGDVTQQGEIVHPGRRAR